MVFTINKRLLYLDVFRGFVALFIIVTHAFSHLILWDFTIIQLDEFPIWMVIIFSPIILLSTCAPVFPLISSTALGYKLKSILNSNNKNDSLIITHSHPNSYIMPHISQKSLKNTFLVSAINYLLLLGISFIHVSLFHYGLHWNGSIQRTLITGSLETEHLMWTDIQVLFQTDAIGLIAVNGLISLVTLMFLWRKKGYLKTKRNLIILTCIAIGWFCISPLLHSRLDTVFFNALDEKNYLIALCLKFIIGPPNSTFPNVAYGFLGLIFGISMAEKKSNRFFHIIGFIIGPIIMLGAGIYISIYGLNLTPEALGYFVPLEIQILDIGYILFIQAIFIELLEFRGSNNLKKRVKRTKFLVRFGIITMTIYVFESIICVINLKWYMPLWNLIPEFPGDRFLQLFLFIGMQIFIWWGISKTWEKSQYKFSLEWILITLRAMITQYHSSRLNNAIIERKYIESSENLETFEKI
ncbi:hypothetical protein [Candidatus Harpocratesius sp.]